MVILLFAVSCGEQKNFNSTEWKNWKESEATMHTRWLMHKDLLNQYELRGISKDSILSLLGKPNTQHLDKFYYNLGYPKKRGGIAPATMTIEFKNGFVVDIEVTKR